MGIFEETILPYTTWGAGIIAFAFGFFLVYRNLRKINLVEGEKFNGEDWFSCGIFGIVFGLVVMFIIKITAGFIVPSVIEQDRSIGIIIILLFAYLIFYPLWNVIILGKPTSDSTTDFDKWLETKFLDRVKGKWAYLASVGIFVIIYLVPVIIAYFLLKSSGFRLVQLGFIWFLLIPLFFLNYFAASGQIAGIITATYTHEHHIRKSQKNVRSGLQSNVIKKTMHVIFLLIAWIPFLLTFYNLFSTIQDAFQIQDVVSSETRVKGPWDSLMLYINLGNTVIFGLKGFFSKFWNKKSKTKTTDFVFSGYIFIAIGFNVLIDLFLMDAGLVSSVFEEYVILAPIKDALANPAILLPISTIRSFIIVIYGTSLLINRKSDFHADIKLQTLNKAFGIQGIDQLQNPKKPSKKKKQDLSILVKSVLLTPVYNSYGIDSNESIRKKAAQYLYLAAYETPEIAQKVTDIIMANTIEIKEYLYLSKEAVDLLGEIGVDYPEIVTDRLIEGLSGSPIQMQQYILDAMGDIGENKENLTKVIDKIKPFLVNPRYEMRRATCNSIVEMIVEGDYRDQKIVDIVLNTFYEVLDNYPEEEEFVETALDSILDLTLKIPKEIEFDRIVPFLDYDPNGEKDPDTVNHLLQNAITIIAYIVYHNMGKFPLERMLKFTEDKRSFIRYVAVDAVGNYILTENERLDDLSVREYRNKVLALFVKISLEDEDEDVREMANESLEEFMIINRENDYNQIKIEGQTVKILDHYLAKLDSSDPHVAENASETLKFIAPLFQENIYMQLAPKIQGSNLEVARDCMVTLGKLSAEVHALVDLNILYKNLEHTDSTIRAKSVATLGFISYNREDIDEQAVLKLLNDTDPTVRLETIFSLGKIGANKTDAETITSVLIEEFFKLDRSSEANISETELYAESLGTIGAKHPSNEIVITLQQALMGDTHVFAKDVVAKALYLIGEGMVRSGKAKRMIENDAFYNAIAWLKAAKDKEYSIGNLIIILIEALQQKGIPDSVMNEISDAMQDLLPVFLFVKQKKPNGILLTIKELLSQAYYSNYNQEILETMDRIDSLISFKAIFEETNQTKEDIERMRFYSQFFSKQFTPDGKQFYDQGMLFMLEKTEAGFLDYALKSFEIAIELEPHEYFTPDALFQIGKISFEKENFAKAEEYLTLARDTFASLDDVSAIKECQDVLDLIPE